MDKDTALRLALEVLEKINFDTGNPDAQDAIKPIKAALEAKDEPVAFFDWYDNAHWGNEDFKEGCHRAWNAAIKYTTPPQRKPLSEEEIGAILEDVNAYGTRLYTFARAIEAAHGIIDPTDLKGKHDA